MQYSVSWRILFHQDFCNSISTVSVPDAQSSRISKCQLCGKTRAHVTLSQSVLSKITYFPGSGAIIISSSPIAGTSSWRFSGQQTCIHYLSFCISSPSRSLISSPDNRTLLSLFLEQCATVWAVIRVLVVVLCLLFMTASPVRPSLSHHSTYLSKTLQYKIHIPDDETRWPRLKGTKVCQARSGPCLNYLSPFSSSKSSILCFSKSAKMFKCCLLGVIKRCSFPYTFHFRITGFVSPLPHHQSPQYKIGLKWTVCPCNSFPQIMPWW